MRLTEQQRAQLRGIAREIFGDEARVLVFGSRLDDAAKGGDVDLLIQPGRTQPDNAALAAARMAARAERLLNGRRVDVVLDAPNRRHLPIHEIARRNGVPL